ESQTGRGSDPEYTLGILQKTVHIFRRQTLRAPVCLPAAVCKRTQTARCSKPHGSIGTFKNRSNRVRRQAAGICVCREFPVTQPADSAAQSSGPDRSVTAQINGVNTILSQSVLFGISFTRGCVTFQMKTGQA